MWWWDNLNGGIAGSWDHFRFNFGGTTKIFSQQLHRFTLPPAVLKCSHFSTISPALAVFHLGWFDSLPDRHEALLGWYLVQHQLLWSEHCPLSFQLGRVPSFSQISTFVLSSIEQKGSEMTRVVPWEAQLLVVQWDDQGGALRSSAFGRPVLA